MTDVQKHRDEAYKNGWDDGYAEGFGKATADAERALAEAREALKPFAKAAGWFDDGYEDFDGRMQAWEDSDIAIARFVNFEIGDIRRARAALADAEVRDG